MDLVKEETMEDLFAAPADIVIATDFCKGIHAKMLPRLAIKLSELSGLELPETFWRTAFGYWLYRHICVTYEKYSYLSAIDVDEASLHLLEKASFYTPLNHIDYLYCFCRDFGVQQLVSQYYYLFARREYSSISLRFKLPARPKTLVGYGKDCLRKGYRLLKACSATARKAIPGVEPKVALCGFFSTPHIDAELYSRSNGAVAPIIVPTIQPIRSVDETSRKRLLEIPSDNDFEFFFVQTLYNCLPQMFLEQFRPSHDLYLRDIKKKKFTHIVSESWISDMSCSIYIAVAQQEGRVFIAHEHGSGTVFDKTHTYWIDVQACDRFVTVGWQIDHDKMHPGGFVCRNIIQYKFNSTKTDILYVARTNLPYLMEFNIYNVPNTKMVKSLKRVRAFFDLLPEPLSDFLRFRPRREPNFWNTEHALEVEERRIRVDTGVFSESLGHARIVVIDHLSTGAAEILLRGIPCIIIQDDDPIEPVVPELQDIYKDLKDCGVMHTSAASAVRQVAAVYGNVMQWWEAKAVRDAVGRLVAATLAPPSKTIDYLISCCAR